MERSANWLGRKVWGYFHVIWNTPVKYLLLCYGLHARNTDVYVRITTRDLVPRNKAFLFQ